MLEHISPSSPRLTTYTAVNSEAFFFCGFLLLASFPTKFSDRPLWYFGLLSAPHCTMMSDILHISPYVSPYWAQQISPSFSLSCDRNDFVFLSALLDFAILHPDYISVCRLIAQFVGASDIGSVLSWPRDSIYRGLPLVLYISLFL